MKAFTLAELIIVLLIIFCLVLLLMGGIDFFVYLFLGWIWFLRRVTQELTVDWPIVVLAVTCVALFTMGSHLFCAWLHTARGSAGQPTASRPWRWAWSLSLTALFVVLFAAGTAMVGVMHQVSWIWQDEEPFFTADYRSAPRRMQSSYNLKQIGLAAHNYHDVYNSLPAGTLVDQHGLPLHGWQTQLLPWLEQTPLFDQIDLTRPWDDSVNRELFAQSIDVYRNPGLLPNSGAKDTDPTFSDYSANQHVISGSTPKSRSSITDGTSQTLLFGEIKDQRKPWGYPVNARDPGLGINKSPEGFGGPYPGGSQFTMTDGSVRFISENIDPTVLKALATPAGHEDITAADFE